MSTHYSSSKKQRILELYDQGYGCTLISKHLGISESHTNRLINRYLRYGSEGLGRLSYSELTPKIKIQVVKEVLERSLSCNQSALKYGVSESSAYSWVCKVKSQGYKSIYEVKKRGRPPKPMKQPRTNDPQTELEKCQLENERLRTEIALLKKVKALVEKRETRMRAIGQKPSKN